MRENIDSNGYSELISAIETMSDSELKTRILGALNSRESLHLDPDSSVLMDQLTTVFGQLVSYITLESAPDLWLVQITDNGVLKLVQHCSKHQPLSTAVSSIANAVVNAININPVVE